MLFVCLWALMFVLYLPAAKAGFVSDFTGWLQQVRYRPFWEYMNRSGFKVVSMYQGTQFVTWVYYQLFGASEWAWHILFITLHTANATLLYILCATLLRDAGVEQYRPIGYTGVVLFCVSPYVSEVVVWEPSFHYLQGLLILLLVLVWVQRYCYTGERRYVWYACVAYLFSIHTLEVFYITPWLALSLGWFYKGQLPQGKAMFGRVARYFFLPMLLLFALRLLEYRLLYGDWVSRIGSQTVLSLQDAGLGKPLKYLFHLLPLGRYLPAEWHIGSASMGDLRSNIYAFCDSGVGMTMFYGGCVSCFAWGLLRYGKMSGRAKVALLLGVWTFIALLLITPLWFGDLLLIVYDRYTYFTIPFLFMLVAIGIWSIRGRYVRVALLVVLLLANLRYTIQVNRYWGKGARIVDRLLHHLPETGDRTVILLNMPESMHGAPMMSASDPSEYKLMRDLLVPERPIKGKVYDALSFNMVTPDDGAHAQVLNDSTIRVKLNQYGTWWWYQAMGGHDYENEDYKLRINPGGDYDLTLKKPANGYILFYQVGDKWKQVDMSKTYEQY
ncbi:hypothetical protein GCM10023093_13110 [Nemorincola caseinilytica]|uniref:DUF2723 domain-containing protein n=2 Tax=Nemorincola caseinilytica TaxID=2054315 RepID=A0ABP8NEC0_9BACT